MRPKTCKRSRHFLTVHYNSPSHPTKKDGKGANFLEKCQNIQCLRRQRNILVPLRHKYTLYALFCFLCYFCAKLVQKSILSEDTNFLKSAQGAKFWALCTQNFAPGPIVRGDFEGWATLGARPLATLKATPGWGQLGERNQGQWDHVKKSTMVSLGLFWAIRLLPWETRNVDDLGPHPPNTFEIFLGSIEIDMGLFHSLFPLCNLCKKCTGFVGYFTTL